MLTQDQIITFLLERCPKFAPTWEDHQNGVTSDVGPYIDVAEFVHFVLDSYDRGNRELMPRAFQWLGPKSRAEWDELVEVWRGKNSLADVVSAELKQKCN